jgi:hypothetical protein
LKNAEPAWLTALRNVPFPDSVRLQVLVRSGRHCCVCHDFAGRTANVHHIEQEALGGSNTLDNAICNGLKLNEPPGDEASVVDAYVLGILVKLDDPSLVVLSALASCPDAANVDIVRDPIPNVSFVSLPRPQIVAGDFDWQRPQRTGLEVPWPWLALKEKVLALREQRLLHFHSSDARADSGTSISRNSGRQ